MRRVLIIIMSTFFLCAFQNCSEVEFAQTKADAVRTADQTGGIDLPDPDSSDPDDPLKAFEYLCVLEQDDRPLRTDLSFNVIVPGTTSPKEVCMTRNACENIVSQAYVVEEARHYPDHCANNPRVMRLDDDAIQQYVDDLI